MTNRSFKLVAALFLLVLSLGFASAGVDDASADTLSLDGGDDNVTSKVSQKQTGNPFLALGVVLVCLVLIRYRE